VTGSWTVPVALLLGLAVVQVVVAHLISRTPIAARKR
jgi:CP family cyanate transporter-like MFS transporter